MHPVHITMAPASIVVLECDSDVPAEPHVQIVRAVVESLIKFSANYATIMLLQHGFDMPDYRAIYDLMIRTYDPNGVTEIINALGVMFEVDVFLFQNGKPIHHHAAGSELRSFVVVENSYNPGFYATPLIQAV